MKLYINENRLTESSCALGKNQILMKVEESLDDEIIDKIYLDAVEVSLAYFEENTIALNELETIRFVSKKMEELIKETLLEAKEYLPRVQNGLIEVIDLYRLDEISKASEKLVYCLEGLEWYIEVMSSILNLDKNDNEKEENLLIQFNISMTTAMAALKKENYQYLADILEVKIIDYLKQFNEVNDNLLQCY